MLEKNLVEKVTENHRQWLAKTENLKNVNHIVLIEEDNLNK